MTLEVEPAKVREFGTWLDHMVGNTESAVSYAGHTRIDSGGAGNLMLKLIPVVDDLHSSTDGLLRHLGAVLDESASEVFRTARQFEDTDLATARALDLEYPL